MTPRIYRIGVRIDDMTGRIDRLRAGIDGMRGQTVMPLR